MKKNLSVSFQEPEHKGSSLLHYYGSANLNTEKVGSGWSIDGTFSTDASPQPTPPPSPRAKNKVARLEMAQEAIISNQLSNLDLKAESFTWSASSVHTPSTKPITQSSAEELSSHLTNLQLKSKPIPITKKKKARRAKISLQG